VFRFILAATLALLAGTGAAPVQQTQIVRLTRSADGLLYRFAPGRITARPGTTIEFRAENGAPFQIAFEPADLDARGRGLIAAALSHPGGELRSPVLADSGSRFRMTVPSLQPGSYRFFCLTHIAYRMAGLLIVR
jgi:plastocyanin